MGRARQRREAFFQNNAKCIYCGSPANTIDHCPPKSFFVGRAWPEGYEFACCVACNARSALDEMIVAMMVRMGGTGKMLSPRDEMKSLYQGVENNHPGLLASIFDGEALMSSIEKEKLLLGICNLYTREGRLGQW